MRLLDRVTNKIFSLFYDLFQPKPKPIVPATPQLVLKRFRQLFKDHGVEETQIPRVFQEITLDDLKSDDSLLKKLTTDFIDEVAQYFNVRVEWLEGIDNVIYRHRSCYKRPQLFFKFLNEIKYDEWDFPFRVITPEKSFDRHDDHYQPFTLLFVEKIGEIGEENIYRYFLDTGWAWDHYTCRIQLKAMAMLYWQKARHPITLHTVPRDVYFQIEDAEQIPHHYLGALLSDPSIEDYIITEDESRVSKEADELPVVIDYIKENNLADLEILKSTINPTCDLNDESPKQAKASKGGSAKHQALSQIKSQFLQQYADPISKNKISARQAAFDFYDSLNEEQEKMLSRSEKDYEKASPDERRMNAERTLTKYYSSNKKH